MSSPLSPGHDEKFRMMLERLMGYCTMRGRDLHKNPDAHGGTIRRIHREIIDYAEARMAAGQAGKEEDRG